MSTVTGALRAGAFAATLIAAASAHAGDAANVCADDAEHGQAVRDAGNLVEARALFVRCSQASCPSMVQKACVQWLLAIDERIPTIVPSARDDAGRDLTDVQLSIDGHIAAHSLTGSALPVNPGSHVLHFERAGRRIEQALVVREGERARIVPVQFLAPVPAPPARDVPPPVAATSRAAIPTAAYVLGGISVVSFGLFAYLGLDGASQYDRLDATCHERCSPSDIDAVRRQFVIADIALGVGIASLLTAGILILTNRTSTPLQHAANDVVFRF